MDKKTFYTQWANQAVQNTGYASCAPADNPVELFARMKNDISHDRKIVAFSEFMTLQVPCISFQDWLTLIHVGRMVMDTKTEQGYLYNGNYTTLQTELFKRPTDVFSLITHTLEDYKEWYRQQDVDFDRQIVDPLMEINSDLQNLKQKYWDTEGDEHYERQWAWENFESCLLSKLNHIRNDVPYRVHSSNVIYGDRGARETLHLFYIPDADIYGYLHAYNPC